MLANLDLTEGKYYFYGQTFDITSGSVMFNQIGALNPELDITAKTQLGNLGITLDITGNMETPHLEFYSDNATFTQDDLTQLVLGISNEGSVQGFVGQFVSHNLERIAQQTLGLDVVELQTDAMRFTVGKRIAGGLSLKYSQSLGEEDTLGALYQLEYRFSRNFTIGAMQSPEGSYLMNVNFRWEY